ncbi:MAG: hypothetical protein A2V66_07760 [Ignavibacteria bacterium RBG_13_36_8]|nr:MAG: hypothetical protein A2V66_07760 [Ignavibacteria bacterium RBG_13_36_8]
MKLFRKGEILTKEGSKNQDLFILIDGKVGVFKGDVMVAEFTEEGTIIGEMSFILNRPRTATIKAVEDTNVIVLQADMYELMKRYPDIMKKIIKNLAERLMNLTDEYYQLAKEIDLKNDIRK